jgi:hypothetical protein
MLEASFVLQEAAQGPMKGRPWPCSSRKLLRRFVRICACFSCQFFAQPVN